MSLDFQLFHLVRLVSRILFIVVGITVQVHIAGAKSRAISSERHRLQSSKSILVKPPRQVQDTGPQLGRTEIGGHAVVERVGEFIELRTGRSASRLDFPQRPHLASTETTVDSQDARQGGRHSMA